jgi:hypothetical protein
MNHFVYTHGAYYSQVRVHRASVHLYIMTYIDIYYKHTTMILYIKAYDWVESNSYIGTLTHIESHYHPRVEIIIIMTQINFFCIKSSTSGCN